MSAEDGPVPGFAIRTEIQIDPETGEQIDARQTITEVADVDAVFDEERG